MSRHVVLALLSLCPCTLFILLKVSALILLRVSSSIQGETFMLAVILKEYFGIYSRFYGEVSKKLVKMIVNRITEC